MLKAELSLFEIYSGEEVLSCIEISLESSLLLGIDLNGKSGDDGTDVWVPLSSEVRRVGELADGCKPSGLVSRCGREAAECE